MLKIIS